MARSTPTLAQFNAGELTPLLLGRVDLQFYTNGLSRALNCISLPHGPLARRPGFRHGFMARETASAIRPFVFAPGDAYGVELGEFVARLFDQNGNLVMDGASPLELETPWTAAQARAVKWVQSADVLILVHPQTPPQHLRRLPGPVFTLSEYVLQDGPYYAPNITGTTMTVSATGTGAKTVTASTAVFVAEDVGRHFRIKAGASSAWVWGVITAFTDDQHVTVDFQTSVNSTSAQTDWRMGLYGQATGYPCAAAIHQQRLALASNCTDTYPRVDLSKSGDFPTFSPGTADDDGIALAVDGDEVPVLRNLRSLDQLVAITLGGVHKIGADSLQSAMTPTNSKAKMVGAVGGDDVAAVIANQAIVHLNRFGKAVREIQWDTLADNYKLRDISIRAEHLGRNSKFVDLTWAGDLSLLVLPRADGTLVLFTYDPDQDVLALCPAELAGGARVESVCTLPSTDGDEIWALVRRANAAGVTVRSVEVLTRLLIDAQIDALAVALDASVTTRDAPAADLTLLATAGDSVDLASSFDAFAPGDVGRQVIAFARGPVNKLNLPTWSERRGTIAAVADARHATIELPPDRDGWEWPASVLEGEWFLSLTEITGLAHLAGRADVMGLIDGEEHAGLVVSAGGAITGLDPFAVATTGLAAPAEARPMPLEPNTQLGGAMGKVAAIPWARLRLVRSKGLGCVGHDGTLNEMLPRDGADAMDSASPLVSGDIEIPNDQESGDTPVAPLLRSEGAYPFCITALAPDVDVGEQ